MNKSVQEQLVLLLDNAYCPYSNFRVASIAVGQDGTLFTGVNVENASYGLSICAERNAICSLVASGRRKVKTVFDKDPIPCGACLQFLSEFASDTRIVIIKSCNGEISSSTHRLNDLLTTPFKMNNGQA